MKWEPGVASLVVGGLRIGSKSWKDLVRQRLAQRLHIECPIYWCRGKVKQLCEVTLNNEGVDDRPGGGLVVEKPKLRGELVRLFEMIDLVVHSRYVGVHKP